jgi:hypothetical protein
MKYYHVTLQVNDSAPLPSESNCALLRLEMLLTVGDNATHVPSGHVGLDLKSVPTTVGDLIKGTLADLHLQGLMSIREVEEITREDMEHYAYNT